MSEYVNLLIGLAMALNLLALGSSRLPTLITAMSVQGMALGVMPLLMEEHLDWRIVLVEGCCACDCDKAGHDNRKESSDDDINAFVTQITRLQSLISN